MAMPNAGVDSLETTAKIARFGTWATIAACVPLVGLYMWLFAMQIGAGYPSLDLYGLIALATLAYFLFYVLTGIVVLFWVYRAHSNLRDAGAEDLKHSPAWAVFSWIIPIISYFVPFLAMRALYNRSHGEESWNSDASVSDVATWWTCYVTGSLILTFTSITAAINSIPGVWLTTPPAADTGLNIAAYVLMAGSGLLLIRIMRAITNAQRQGLSSASVFE